MGGKLKKSQWGPSTAWLQTFFKIYYYVFSRTAKKQRNVYRFGIT